MLEEPVTTQKQWMFEAPRAKVRMWFANGCELRCHLDYKQGPGMGAIFVGEKGKIEINRGKVTSNPASLLRRPDNPANSKAPVKAVTQPHFENWIQCIKTRQRCAADIEIGQRGHTIAFLVNIARDMGRVGEKLRWDPVAEQFTNSDEANALLRRPRRPGFELVS